MSAAAAPVVWPSARPTTWRAAWIAPAGLEPARRNVVFRARRRLGRFELRDGATLYIAAESVYRLWVNGRRVGQGPVRGSRTVSFFDAYNVAAALQGNGDDWLAVEVTCPAVATFKAAPVRAAVLVQVDAGGGTVVTATDAAWQASCATDHRADVPMYAMQQGFTEWRDLAAEPIGWQMGQGEGDWPAAVVVAPTATAPGGRRLLARDVPPLAERAVAPVAVPLVASVAPAPDEPVPAEGQTAPNVAQLMAREPQQPSGITLAPADGAFVVPPAADGGGTVVVLDYARPVTGGGFKLDVTAPAGTLLDVGYGEHLTDGRVRTFIPNRQGNYSFADRFLLRAGRQTVEPTHERGFRMLQLVVRGNTAPVTFHACHGVDRRHPAAPVATFECSDPLLNRVWTACIETIAACASDTFVDCPWREAAYWVNDLLVEQASWLRATGDATLPARCLRLTDTERSADGRVMGVCPSPGEASLAFPATNFFMANMLAEHHAFTGDASVADEQVDALVKVLDLAATWADEGGLIVPPDGVWNFIEWSYTFGPGGQRNLSGRATAVLNWFYADGLRATADLLVALGRPTDAARVGARATAVAGAIDARLWSSDLGAYAEWEAPDAPASQLPQAVALLSGLAPAHRRAALRDALTREDLLAPELYLHHLVFRAMTATGDVSAALERVRRHWGPIVAAGSATIWESNVHERGEAAFGSSGSLCHGFSTGPIDLFTGGVLGVVPATPGFRTFILRPQLGGLAYARGTVPTPHGVIRVDLRREAGDAIAVHVNVPPGTHAITVDGATLPPGHHVLHLPAPSKC